MPININLENNYRSLSKIQRDFSYRGVDQSLWDMLTYLQGITIKLYTKNSQSEDNSMVHSDEYEFEVNDVVQTLQWFDGYKSSGGIFRVIAKFSSKNFENIGSFKNEFTHGVFTYDSGNTNGGFIVGSFYLFEPVLLAKNILDIRSLGVQCEDGVTGWHSRFESIVEYARNNNLTLTGAGVLSCTETVDLESVHFEGENLEFQGGTAQTTTGAFGPTFYTETFSNDAVTFNTGTPVEVVFAGHGFSGNEEIKFGVSNGGRLPGSLAILTKYYVRNIIDTDTFTISASAGGAEIAATTSGVGTFYLFQGTDQSGIDTIDFLEHSGRVVRKGIVVKAGAGTTHGFKSRDSLRQRIRVRGDGNFDFTTLSSCIGITHSGDRGPHGVYDYSSNYTYVCVGTEYENEKHKVYVRGSYVVHGLYLFRPVSGSNDSMDWEVALNDYFFSVYENEGLDSYQRYTFRLEPRLDPADSPLVSALTGDEPPCALIRNGKCSVLSGLMRGHNGVLCILVSGRTNGTGTSNRAWADTVFFDNLHIIHGYGTVLNIQNCRKVAGQIFIKDWDDPNGAGQAPAAAIKIGRVSHAAGLRVFGANVRNTVGVEVGDATYYSRDAHLGHYSIEMGDLVQFDTGANELTGASGNPTTLDAALLVKMKGCVIDLTGCRGNIDIEDDVIENSTVIMDYNARLYTVTVGVSAVVNYGYLTLNATDL